MRISPPSVLAPPDRRHFVFFISVLAGAFVIGGAAAWHYHQAGLTLSHYDAKAHLVVARRVFDNLTPGWQQIGAVWLPLPHLLNLLPVQVDSWYRTGASGVAISVLSFALAALGVARIVSRAAGSRVAGALATCVFALNPDLLYLQSTPMTEALLLAVIVWSASLTWDWVEAELRECEVRGAECGVRNAWCDVPSATRDDAHLTGSPPSLSVLRWRAGLVLAAACLTRYEAWPVTAALLLLAGACLSGRLHPARMVARRVGQVAALPAVAVGAFLLQSRLTVGKWFVTGGFFVPDNIDTGKPFHAIGSVWWGAHLITGYGILCIAAAATIASIVVAVRDPRRRALLMLVALFAVGSLPAYAFFEGHPFRIRYMTPLVPALAVFAGMGAGLCRVRWREAAAVGVFAVLLLTTRPFDPLAPMVLEAQWDSGNSAARRQVTRYLVAHWNGRPIMASMQSLAHYMQELSAASFHLRDFLHEGNGEAWHAALADPARHVQWILMEEWAEGGDELATRAHHDPGFLRGFERVAEGGGVALYRRRNGEP